ncbi:hypothetical protein DYST_01741 [Dyella terrae]|nr:hypothetical protein DYST_01741 [Dyella terrae]
MPGVKKSNPKKGHPRLALAGEAGQFVRGGRAFRQGFLPWRKGIGILADPTAGLLVHPSPPHRGPEGQRPKRTARAASLYIAARQVALLLL